MANSSLIEHYYTTYYPNLKTEFNKKFTILEQDISNIRDKYDESDESDDKDKMNAEIIYYAKAFVESNKLQASIKNYATDIQIEFLRSVGVIKPNNGTSKKITFN